MLFPDSPGHMITELDNFLRMRHLGEIDRNCSYMAVLPQGIVRLPYHIAASCPNVFSPEARIQIMGDDDSNRVAHQIQALRPEMAIDVGQSHFKIALPDAAARSNARLMHAPWWPNLMYWVIRHELMIDSTMHYYRRLAQSRDYCPWRDIPELSDELRLLLGGQSEKLALIHVRTARGAGAENAGTYTDPLVLLPTLAFLKDLGYTLVKVGLEPYPSEWERFSVVRYSGSPLQNYSNDLMLFKAAKFVLANASGFEMIADLLGTPMVSYGRWHLPLPPPGPNCVNLPSLMRNRRTGRLLKFSEQIQFYKDLPQLWEQGNVLSFPREAFEERPPSPDEILASVQEAVALSENFVAPTSEQERFIDLDRKKCFAHVQSRVCQRFLEKFPEALLPGFAD